MREEVVFGDVKLSDYFQVASVTVSNLNVSTETLTVNGMDGVAVLGSSIGSREITVYLMLDDGDIADRREELRLLFGLIDLSEEHRLYISSDNGRYYIAKLNGEQTLNEKTRSSRIALNFLAASPYLHGETQHITIPSGGTVTFNVGGTQTTYPRITGTVTRDGTTNMWGVRLDGHDVMRVPMSVSQAAIDIDCDDMSVLVNGSSGMIDTTSYWFELTAGTHTIQNYLGTGEATVEWETRWL